MIKKYFIWSPDQRLRIYVPFLDNLSRSSAISILPPKSEPVAHISLLCLGTAHPFSHCTPLFGGPIGSQTQCLKLNLSTLLPSSHNRLLPLYFSLINDSKFPFLPHLLYSQSIQFCHLPVYTVLNQHTCSNCPSPSITVHCNPFHQAANISLALPSPRSASNPFSTLCARMMVSSLALYCPWG